MLEYGISAVLVSLHYAVILGWFLDKDVVQQCLRKGTLVEEEQVECVPELIPNSVADENVDICLV